MNQPNLIKEQGIELILNYIDRQNQLVDGLEPYPVSLRNVNWIKFLSKNDFENKKISDFILVTYKHLFKNLEYHLLGNHLLENGFSLLFAAYYFQDLKFYKKARTILKKELKEQILGDGGHFELSPMYHQIILHKLLDCINLVKSNLWHDQELLDILISDARHMLGWLDSITFTNGEIPLINDAAQGVAPSSSQLFDYAKRLGIEWPKNELSDSGYRKVQTKDYELLIDIGSIGPDYIPGHAHSDTFNYLLHHNGVPVVVDTGTSTYDNNNRRYLERSTASHNTVQINNIDQSEVWSSFRVARRAKVVKLVEQVGEIVAIHDGYARINALHQRIFGWEDKSISIHDEILSKIQIQCKNYIHFHPDVSVELNNKNIILGQVNIEVVNAQNVKLKPYYYAEEFNQLTASTYAEIEFSHQMILTFTFP